MRSVAELRLEHDGIALLILGPALSIKVLPQRVLGIGITALNHKTGDNPMENRPVVKARLGQLDKVRNMIRGQIWIELDMYVSELGLDNSFRPMTWGRRSNRHHIGPPSTTDEETDPQQYPTQHEASHGSSITHYHPPSLHCLLEYHDRHLHSFRWKIAAVFRQVDNLIRDLHPFHHFPKDRILPIEKIRVLDDNEELRTGTVGVVRPRHGDNPPAVRNVVKLSLEPLTRSTLTVGLRLIQIFGIGVAALNHKAWNHSMKDRAVVEA